MASYRFTTVWHIQAPIDQVWDAIYESDGWPRWWTGVESVIQLRPADENGIGGLTRYVWKSALPYRLAIDTTATRVERPSALDGTSSGELEGAGHWRLSEEAGGTLVRYEWNVATTKAWMNLLAPLARPFFTWNHDVIMRWGGEGLRRLLEAPRPAARFDPDRLAYLEAAGWRANYDRQWAKLLWLVLELNHEQFGLPWPRALQAAYCITRASVAWVPKDHDLDAVRRYIRAYYVVASRYGRGLEALSPERAAELELRYWIVHRDLSGRSEGEKGPLEEALAELHACLFDVAPDVARSSGVSRARACDTVDLITSRRSPDVENDWARVERYLREAYRQVAA